MPSEWMECVPLTGKCKSKLLKFRHSCQVGQFVVSGFGEGVEKVCFHILLMEYKLIQYFLEGS
jgi:hypothetical protein